MLTQLIPVEPLLKASYTDELARRIFFLSDTIIDFSILQEKNFIHGVTITTQTEISVEEITRKLQYIIANDIRPLHIMPDKILWKSTTKHAQPQEMYTQMIEAGIALEVGEGQICLGEPFLRVMNHFDKLMRAIATADFHAQEYQYPTLIPTSTLTTCGYTTSFPQYLMFVTRLHSDIDTYKSFLEEAKGTENIQNFTLNYCDNVDYCLPPTMCFHTYHQYENRELPHASGFVVTSKGKSFRFESRYARTLERLWDFTIREIVFLGPRDFVLDCRQRFMEKVIALIEDLDLSGHCEVANDPFFANMNTAEKAWSQRLLELKYELRLNVTENRTIAVGSFNFHERFFGEGFKIRSEDQDFVHTACIGFGLERLTYAFLCQYGLDEMNWPDLFRIH